MFEKLTFLFFLLESTCWHYVCSPSSINLGQKKWEKNGFIPQQKILFSPFPAWRLYHHLVYNSGQQRDTPLPGDGGAGHQSTHFITLTAPVQAAAAADDDDDDVFVLFLLLLLVLFFLLLMRIIMKAANKPDVIVNDDDDENVTIFLSLLPYLSIYLSIYISIYE